ncbi:CTP synthase C-terminal region-related (seleno)protein [Chitinophaga qingshengii]|uniref:CTP synthase (glutamine hydrolyzing) n=1 Tax=Chitinophaga qingshengii TaxID=1569794 RepID=A0ABR7TGK7_9BACT|nr:CTP synthase [Chitinophaga qingshengii]MBC9929597.1 CTP synthase [Chitinophaga qingshengii]
MNIAIIGDYDPHSATHPATGDALQHAAGALGITVSFDWIPTENIIPQFEIIRDHYDAYWIAPGSPYRDFAGVLHIIRYARENRIPTIGTCGGFQHMAIEFARHVLQLQDAEHAEYDPYASRLVVTPLSCSLVGQTLTIHITDPHSKTAKALPSDQLTARYYCNFGLNPDYQAMLHQHGFHIVGTDDQAEARILELADHPFFVATLFVPQTSSTAAYPHPLITGFLKSITTRT